MKISTFITILVVIGVIFFLFASMVIESNEYYGSDMNSSEWDEEYDYALQINESVEPLRSSLETIEDEDAGWFTRIAAGIAALPRAVTLVPSVLFDGFQIATSMIGAFFSVLGIPATILIAVSVLVLVWGVIKLIEFFHRYPV